MRTSRPGSLSFRTWAVGVEGACRALELLSGDLDDPSYHAMLEASLDYLRSLGVPKMRLNGYEFEFWATHKGRTEPWLEARPLPVNPTLTPLAQGEDRRIVQMESAPDSNAIYARMVDPQTFQALIDARWNDEDPTRSRTEWKTASSLYDLYKIVGAALSVPPHWAHSEFEPFIPHATPPVDWLPGSAG